MKNQDWMISLMNSSHFSISTAIFRKLFAPLVSFYNLCLNCFGGLLAIKILFEMSPISEESYEEGRRKLDVLEQNLSEAKAALDQVFPEFLNMTNVILDTVFRIFFLNLLSSLWF